VGRSRQDLHKAFFKLQLTHFNHYQMPTIRETLNSIWSERGGSPHLSTKVSLDLFDGDVSTVGFTANVSSLEGDLTLWLKNLSIRPENICIRLDENSSVIVETRDVPEEIDFDQVLQDVADQLHHRMEKTMGISPHATQISVFRGPKWMKEYLAKMAAYLGFEVTDDLTLSRFDDTPIPDVRLRAFIEELKAAKGKKNKLYVRHSEFSASGDKFWYLRYLINSQNGQSSNFRVSGADEAMRPLIKAGLASARSPRVDEGPLKISDGGKLKDAQIYEPTAWGFQAMDNPWVQEQIAKWEEAVSS